MNKKKTKIDNFQSLDILNQKLNDNLKDCFVTMMKTKNLNKLITFMRDIDAHFKEISKQSQLCAKLASFVIYLIKPKFKTVNSQSNIAIKTDPSLMDVSITSKRGPIS